MARSVRPNNLSKYREQVIYFLSYYTRARVFLNAQDEAFIHECRINKVPVSVCAEFIIQQRENKRDPD
jgi:hypothetical protein